VDPYKHRKVAVAELIKATCIPEVKRGSQQMFTEAILLQEATASNGQLNPGTVYTSHNSSAQDRVQRRLGEQLMHLGRWSNFKGHKL